MLGKNNISLEQLLKRLAAGNAFSVIQNNGPIAVRGSKANKASEELFQLLVFGKNVSINSAHEEFNGFSTLREQMTLEQILRDFSKAGYLLFTPDYICLDIFDNNAATGGIQEVGRLKIRLEDEGLEFVIQTNFAGLMATVRDFNIKIEAFSSNEKTFAATGWQSQD